MGKLLGIADAKKHWVGHRYSVRVTKDIAEALERIYARAEKDVRVQDFLASIITLYAKENDPKA